LLTIYLNISVALIWQSIKLSSGRIVVGIKDFFPFKDRNVSHPLCSVFDSYSRNVAVSWVQKIWCIFYAFSY